MATSRDDLGTGHDVELRDMSHVRNRSVTHAAAPPPYSGATEPHSGSQSGSPSDEEAQTVRAPPAEINTRSILVMIGGFLAGFLAFGWTTSNGVFINGAMQRVPRDSEVGIADGDEIQVGDYLILVEETGDAPRAATVMPARLAEVASRGQVDVPYHPSAPAKAGAQSQAAQCP